MNFTRYLMVFFILCNKAFSQESIALQTVPMDTKNFSIYIKEVTDERKEKTLGYIANKYDKNVILNIYPDAPKAIQDFMDVSFIHAEKAKPIYIKIQALEIQQSQSSITDITTRVYVNLIFLEKNKDTLKTLFDVKHYEDEVFPMSNTTEIFETHEKRIRAALENCIQSFMHNYKEKSNTNFKTEGPERETITSIKNQSGTESKPLLGKWYNLLTFKKVFSKHKKGYKISYIGFADNDKDFILPFVMSYDRYSIKSKSLTNQGYRSIDAYTLGGGFDGYFKIHSGVYLNLGLDVPIGMELTKNLMNKKRYNFLIGISAKQGIKIMPWKDLGIVIGAGVFQQIQTSKVYQTNFGFELELGINF